MPRLDAERVAVWRSLGVTVDRLRRRVEAGLYEEFDLTLPRFEVMAALQRAGGSMRVGALCEELDEVPSSLSRRLDRMEDDGFVVRKPTPTTDDGRAVTVSLTRAGREEWRDANIAYRRLVQQHFASVLTDSDLAALHRLFSKLH